MCGILFSVRPINDDRDTNFTELFHKLQLANAARGPDAQNLHRTFITHTIDHGEIRDSVHQEEDGKLVLDFFAAELQLRGNTHVVQPHKRDDDILCWNGEIFEGMDISSQENDGIRLLEKLRSQETMEQVRDVFGTIEGPYAFAYYQAAFRRLFFARDPLGRRSLLIHNTATSPFLILTSVSAGLDLRYDFKELSVKHIYCLELLEVDWKQTSRRGFDSYLVLLPRHSSNRTGPFTPYAEPSKINREIPPPEYFPQVQSLDKIPTYLVQAVDDLIYHLDRSVMLRVRNVPQILGISKGMARIAILFSGGIDSTIIAYLAHRHTPVEEPIDLLNVAFENPRKIQQEVRGNPGGLSKKEKKTQAKIGNMIKPPVDVTYMVPDRVTGLQEVDELRRLCPGRVWNFIEVNVPYEESQPLRPTIESLMLPGRTVMDMSLALALYFASRGIGQINPSGTKPIPYTSNARVLLNGLGSDELLGGYGRHRSAFTIRGWESVIEELELEIERLPTRNLGRDDRVISSHGKEARHPFLSLNLVKFLAELPVHFKMDPRLEVGLGDKMLLRLATRKLGLVEASCRKKRAMQFGSHAARMEGERRGDVPLH